MFLNRINLEYSKIFSFFLHKFVCSLKLSKKNKIFSIISVEVAKVLQYYNRWCNYNRGHQINGWFKTTSLLKGQGLGMRGHTNFYCGKISLLRAMNYFFERKIGKKMCFCPCKTFLKKKKTSPFEWNKKNYWHMCCFCYHIYKATILK